MPIVKVYGIPTICNEALLEKLCEALQKGVASIRELCLAPEQVTVFFPADRLQKGLGEEIIVEIVLFAKPERTRTVRQEIANCALALGSGRGV